MTFTKRSRQPNYIKNSNCTVSYLICYIHIFILVRHLKTYLGRIILQFDNIFSYNRVAETFVANMIILV